MHQLVVAVLAEGTTEPLVDGTTAATTVVRLSPAGAAAWRDLAPGASHALVVGERRHELQVRHHAALAADLGLAVAWRSHLLGPLALVAAARFTAQDASVGLAPARFDDAVAALWDGAWVPKVTALDHPAPSLWQHLRSWLPVRDGYLVTLTGQPRVERVARARSALTGGTGGADAPDVAGARDHLLQSDADLPAAALDLARQRAGALDAAAVPGFSDLVVARFGPGAVELVALPEAVTTGAAARALVECPVCSARVPEGFCPYCRVRPAPQTDLAGAEA